jgi:hypothetical protein
VGRGEGAGRAGEGIEEFQGHDGEETKTKGSRRGEDETGRWRRTDAVIETAPPFRYDKPG